MNAVRAALEKHPVVPALKAIVAHHTGDAGWRLVRPPLVELAPERAGSLLAELRATGFAMQVEGPIS